MAEEALLLNSITDANVSAGADAAGRIAVSGSHGGLFAAAAASQAGLRAVILNDAGVGFEEAGVAGVKALDAVGMAGAAVTADSARIGSARDALDSGIVGYVNDAARALGVVVGAPLREQIGRFAAAPTPKGRLPAVAETRTLVALAGAEALCVDSASLIRPSDAGALIVTGSHGGLIGGDPARACKADARLVAFNDAGGGKDGVGFTRLPALDARRVAAVTVACGSCRIGDARSTLERGVVSRRNAAAAALGCVVGQTLEEAMRAAAA